MRDRTTSKDGDMGHRRDFRLLESPKQEYYELHIGAQPPANDSHGM